LRTKGGNENSYNSGDAVNQFDWERKARYHAVFAYYAKLIQLRRRHPAFRMTSAEDIYAHLSFLESPLGTLTFRLSDHANGDSWKTILVTYNATRDMHSVLLPAGDWTIACQQNQVNEQGLAQASGIIIVQGLSCSILYQATDGAA
jgi:pullulanase